MDSAIRELVERLGPIGAEAVAQVVRRGWMGIYAGLIMCVLVVSGLVTGFIAVKKTEDDFNSTWTVVAFAGFIMAGTALLLAGIFLGEGISDVVAPLPSLLKSVR